MVAMRRRSQAREMEDGGHEGDGREPRMGGTDVFRGVLVIVVALAVGAFVFTRGIDETAVPATGTETEADAAVDESIDADPAVSGTAEDTGATGLTPAPADEPTSTTVAQSSTTAATQAATTEILLRSPAEVKVLVLNGAQTQGIAARGTEVLMSFGYTTAAPKNASSQRPSVILFNPGFEGEAIAVADAFGPNLSSLVTPFDPAAPPIDDTQEANVIVVVGDDGLIPVN